MRELFKRILRTSENAPEVLRKKFFLIVLGIAFALSVLFSFLGTVSFLRGGESYQCGEARLEFYKGYEYLKVHTSDGDKLLECKPVAGKDYRVSLCTVERTQDWTSYLLFDFTRLTVYPSVSRSGLTQDDCSLAGLHYSPDLNLCVSVSQARTCIRAK